MRILKINLHTIIFFLLITIGSYAIADEYHYINMLIGDRASGLGGAYTALSDDTAGCYYNPAGIAFASANSLSASVNAVSISKKIYKEALIGTNGDTYDWEQEFSSLLPNYFGILKKVGPGMLGLSYAVPDAINRRQKQIFSNIRSKYPSNPIDKYSLNMNDSDKTYLIGPSYAYSLSDSLSIGATLYVYYRDMEFIRNDLLEFDQGQHSFSNTYQTTKDWGYKPILGVIFEPIDKLALGLSISKIFITSSSDDLQYIARSSVDNSDPDDILFFPDLHLSSFDDDDFPLTASVGLAYFFSPKLLIAGDMAYYEGISGKESSFNFAIGTEYYFTDIYALRSGFYTDNANTSELSSNGVNQDEHVDIYGISLSLSRFSKNSSITLGFSYGIGNGEANVIQDSNAIYDVSIENISFYISSTYNY